MTKIILASQSKIRKQVLENAGIEFEAISSNVDEDMIKDSMRAENMKPKLQVFELAKAKAIKLSRRYPDAYIIACDQMLSLNNHPFDKVKTMEEAKERLLHFKGKTHYLCNSMVIFKGGEFMWRYDDAPRLKMRDFSDEFLDYYLNEAGEEILSSVGCYQLEKIGVQLFEEIDGDYFSILGLPLLPLLGFFRNHGLVK